MSLNVNRSVDDPFYRYKMPKLLAKVEGKGNGIKTVIPNMAEVAKALHRPASYTTKYFGCELGAQVQMEGDRYIVNGSHEASKLQDLLDGFITRFVLCEGCQNPETNLTVTKKGTIDQVCIACGFRRSVPLAHKLTTYIINHPPNDVILKKEKGSSKEERRAKKNEKGDKAARPDSATPNEATSNANARENGGMISAPPIEESAEDDDGWSVDVSEEAVRAREAAYLQGAVSKLAFTSDLDKSIDERLAIFDRYVADRVDLAKFPAKEVLSQAERLECKEKGVMVLAERLLDGDNAPQLIAKHAALLQHFTNDNEKSQKYLLGSIELLVSKRSALLAKVPQMFKALYDNDIIDEEQFDAWGAKVSKKYISKELSQQIHDKADTFLKWLKEAEEESEEESEDGEDGKGEDKSEDEEETGVEVAFDSAANGLESEAADPSPSGAAGGAKAEEEDFDIDGI